MIPSNKGNIAAVVHEPTTKTGKLAILCPGYLDSKDYTHLVELAKMLAGAGYTAVCFDPTGTWESGGSIGDYTTTQYLADIQTVIDYMLSQYDFENVLIGGHSRGGFMSMLSAARDPRISTVVSMMGSTSGHIHTDEQKRIAWEHDGISISKRDLPNNKDESREYRVPFSHQNDREQYDVLSDLSKIHVPILFIAGEKDTLVTPKSVNSAYNLANEPKQYALMKDMGHDYRLNADEIAAVNARISKFLQNHP